MAQGASADDLVLLSGLLRFKGSEQEKEAKAQNVLDVLQIESVDQLQYLPERSSTTPLTVTGLTVIQCSRLELVGAVLKNHDLLPDNCTPETATLDQWENALKRVNSSKAQNGMAIQQRYNATPTLLEQLQTCKTAHLNVVRTANAMTAGIKLVDDDLELLHTELGAALAPLNLRHLLDLTREGSKGVVVPPIEDTNATPMTERGPQLIRMNLRTRVDNNTITAEDAELILTALNTAIMSERMRHCQVEALDDIIAAAVAANRNIDEIETAVLRTVERSPINFPERRLTSNLLYSILIRILSNSSFYHILTEDNQNQYQDGKRAWARINEYDSDPKLQARKIVEDFRRLRKIELIEGKTVAAFLNEFENVKSSIIKRLGPNGCQPRDESTIYNTFIDSIKEHPTLGDVTTSYRGLNGDFDTMKEISERLRNAEKEQDTHPEQGANPRRPAAGNRTMAGMQSSFVPKRGDNVFKVAGSSIPAVEWDRYNKDFDKLKWQLEKKTFAEWQKKGLIPTEFSYDHPTLESFTAARIANYKNRLDTRKKGQRGKGSYRRVEKDNAEFKKEPAETASANRVFTEMSDIDDGTKNNAPPQYDFTCDDYDHLL